MRQLNPVLISVIVVGLIVAGSVALILRWSRAEKEAITSSAAPRESPNQMLAKQFLDSAKKAIVAGELDDAEKHLDDLEKLCASDPALKEFKASIGEVYDQIANVRKQAEEAFFKGRAEFHEATIESARGEIGKLKGPLLTTEILTASTPEGVWYRSVAPIVDDKASRFYADPLGGTRVKLIIKGYAEGSTPQEMDRKVSQLLTNLRSKLQIPDHGQGPKNEELWGYNKCLCARFDPPQLQSTTFLSTLPLPPNMTPEQKKIFKPTSKGLDFTLTISFEKHPQDK